MNDVIWNFGEVDSLEAFQRMVQSTLNFPHHYGKNRDAFWDCLNELVSPTVLRVQAWNELPEELKLAIHPYLEMCKEYEKKTGGLFRLEAIQKTRS